MKTSPLPCQTQKLRRQEPALEEYSFKQPRKQHTSHMHESLMVSLTAGTSEVPFIPNYKTVTQSISELKLEQLYSQGTMQFRSVILCSSSSSSSPHTK